MTSLPATIRAAFKVADRQLYLDSAHQTPMCDAVREAITRFCEESSELAGPKPVWLARADGGGLQLKLRARWRWAPLHAPAGTALPAAGVAELSVPCAAQADALADAYRRSVMLLAARIVASS